MPVIFSLRAQFGPPKKMSIFDRAVPWLVGPAILAYLVVLVWLWPITRHGLLSLGRSFPFPGLGDLLSGIALAICALVGVGLVSQILCTRMALNERRKKLAALGRISKARHNLIK